MKSKNNLQLSKYFSNFIFQKHLIHYFGNAKITNQEQSKLVVFNEGIVILIFTNSEGVQLNIK